MSRPIAEIVDYNEWIAALKKRADELEISRETIDDLCGFPDRLSNKLLCFSKPGVNGRRPTARAFGPKSLGPILQALGLKIVLVEDEKTLELYRERRVKRNNSQVRHLATGQETSNVGG